MADLFQMEIRGSESKEAFPCLHILLSPTRRICALASQTDIQPVCKKEAFPGLSRALPTRKSWEGMLQPGQPASPWLLSYLSANCSVCSPTWVQRDRDVRVLGQLEQGETSPRLDTERPLSFLGTHSLPVGTGIWLPDKQDKWAELTRVCDEESNAYLFQQLLIVLLRHGGQRQW